MKYFFSIHRHLSNFEQFELKKVQTCSELRLIRTMGTLLNTRWSEIIYRLTRPERKKTYQKMTEVINSYKKAAADWERITHKIFGQTSGLVFQIIPNGRIYFIKDGVRLIRADYQLIGFTIIRDGISFWEWAWSSSKRLGLISDDFRLSKEEADDYIKENQVNEKYSSLLGQPRFKCATNPQMETALRAICMHILDGKFLYEGQISPNSNVLLSLTNVKKMRQKIDTEEAEQIDEAKSILKKSANEESTQTSKQKRVEFEENPTIVGIDVEHGDDSPTSD